MEILEEIRNRRSIRSFSSREVDPAAADLLFEAARWAPSSMNDQPWSYHYAFKNDAANFGLFIDCLTPGNQVWAKDAPLIILSLVRKKFSKRDRYNRHSMYDAGAANALLSIQAVSMGLQVHQMGGFSIEKTLETFNIDPEVYEPVTFIAVGYRGDGTNLPEELRNGESKIRTRHDVKEFAFLFKDR